MSFFFDLPALFVIGALLYYAGKRLELERLTKITIGLLIVFCFILFSLLLYADIFRMPEFSLYINSTRINITSTMTGPQFMFQWPFPTGLSKDNVHWLFVIVLFALYPVAIFMGYASALLNSKGSKKVLNGEVKSYGDVKSHENLKLRKKIDDKVQCFIARFPDSKNGINNLEDTVKKAVDDLGSMEHFVHDKDKVLIKVNICGGVPGNPATYTSQKVVGQVVHMVRKAGGVPKVCDADMIWAKFWETAKAEGWTEWAKQENVDLINLSDTELVWFNFGERTVFEDNKERVSKELLVADVIISIPKMKTHLLTGVTLGMKNMYGTLPEIDKAKYHQAGINEVIYWINYAFPPTITIIDGSIGGEAIGPLSASPVPYNTIVASNNVVIADAIAAKLIGYDHPFEDIRHLALTAIKKEKGTENYRLLTDKILDAFPEYENSIEELLGKNPNPKDGKWAHPTPEAPNMYENLVENLLEFPLMDTLFNIGADFFLFDLARLPFLKHINEAALNILYDEVPRFWTLKKKTEADKRREIKNSFFFFLLLVVPSLFFFNLTYSNLFKSLNTFNSSIWFLLGFVFSLIVGALFARRMKTGHLVAVTLTSLVVAFFVEHYNQIGKWVTYSDKPPLFHDIIISGIPYEIPIPPWYAFFSVPIFIIGIIGFAYFLSRFFKYVNLDDKDELKFIPWLGVVLIFFTILGLEGEINANAVWIIVIYIVFAFLGLFFNSRQALDWNLALAIVAVVLGGLMELAGTVSGLWGYPSNPTGGIHMPIFICFTWVLNTWAACGLALIGSGAFGIPEINLGKPFVEPDDRLKGTSEVSDKYAFNFGWKKENCLTNNGKSRDVELPDNFFKMNHTQFEKWFYQQNLADSEYYKLRHNTSISNGNVMKDTNSLTMHTRRR